MRQRLLTADASPDEVEDFAEHLGECPKCAPLVDQAFADDTLAKALRNQATLGEVAAAAETLIEQMLKIKCPPAATQTIEETVDSLPASCADPSAASPAELLAFLGPSQADGEIGRLGGYRILKVLGSGGMGMVLQAEDLRLRRTVAMKVMKPEAAAKSGARERFLREAQAAAAIEHPNVVSILHVGEDRDVPYLIMPWLKGKSLEDRLREDPPLDVGESARLGSQVAAGLAAAHQQGLIHRDIKPANLWLDESGQVKILDFGLARDLTDEVHLTHSGMILGTPSYMSPEQANGEQVDPRCDLFSLGVVLYRMTTGRLPFRTGSVMSALASLAIDTPASPQSLNPSIPNELSELILALLEKEPAKRPSSAIEIAERLRFLERSPNAEHDNGSTLNLSAGVEAGPHAIEAMEPTSAKRRPQRKLLALGFIAFLVAASTIFFMRTPTGTVRVEILDDSIEATLTKNGAVFKGTEKSNPIAVAVGDHTLKVRHGDLEFETKQFVLRRGDTVHLKVELLPGKIQVVEGDRVIGEENLHASDPDRRAAEYVLSIGGTVKIDDQTRDRTETRDLPRKKFKLTEVSLTENQKVDDRGLANFDGCKDLKFIDLGGTKVGNAGLVHFRQCRDLNTLCLWNTHVTDEGLAHFKDCSELSVLFLWDTQISDAGLAHLKDCRKLKEIRLLRTKVTDAGLVCFEHWKDLTLVDLSDTSVTDAGLVHLKGCKALTVFGVNDTKVKDAGLANFRGCSALSKIYAWNTDLSDPGFVHFKDCVHIAELHIWKTRIGDQGLSAFKNCKNLKLVYVQDTLVGDSGLEHLKNCNAIECLDVSRTRVTNAGLAHLKDHANLHELLLNGLSITDAGLIHLHSLKGLRKLHLRGTKTSAAALEKLRKALPDCVVYHDGKDSRTRVDERKKTEPLANHPDRKAAEYVLFMGGSVRVIHQTATDRKPTTCLGRPCSRASASWRSRKRTNRGWRTREKTSQLPSSTRRDRNLGGPSERAVRLCC
ncbi:MAG: protein kinase [Gemmataceae bacterium]